MLHHVEIESLKLVHENNVIYEQLTEQVELLVQTHVNMKHQYVVEQTVKHIFIQILHIELILSVRWVLQLQCHDSLDIEQQLLGRVITEL
jgi:hypothetical protein